MRPRSLRILVIDDNPADAEILRRNLEKIPEFDVEFVHYVDWEAVRDAVLNNQGDCLLLDYHLEDASGLEVLSELRGLGADLPVIAVTGNGNEMVAVEALNRGAQDYLVKGQWDAKLLVRSILYAIERQRNAQYLEASLAEKEELLSQLQSDLRRSQSGLSGTLQRSTVPPSGTKVNPEEQIMEYLQSHPEGADMKTLERVVDMRVVEVIRVVGPLMASHKIRSTYPLFFAVG